MRTIVTILGNECRTKEEADSDGIYMRAMFEACLFDLMTRQAHRVARVRSSSSSSGGGIPVIDWWCSTEHGV